PDPGDITRRKLDDWTSQAEALVASTTPPSWAVGPGAPPAPAGIYTMPAAFRLDGVEGELQGLLGQWNVLVSIASRPTLGRNRPVPAPMVGKDGKTLPAPVPEPWPKPTADARAAYADLVARYGKLLGPALPADEAARRTQEFQRHLECVG